jgi:hypothetical protein
VPPQCNNTGISFPQVCPNQGVTGE